MIDELEKPEEQMEAGQTLNQPVGESESLSKTFSKLSKTEIIETLKEKVLLPVEDVKEDIDLLKQAYYKLKKNEADNRRSASDVDPESEETETPVADTTEDTLKELLTVFKEKKAEYLAQLEKKREENLAAKQQVLADLKALVDDSDNIGKRYNEFKDLQQSFKENMDVPVQAAADLWKTFQQYTEQFYDLLKINKELRDYDFKKNLEQKQALCESAEALAAEADIVVAFKSLQQLHDEWRAIGPVAKELREELWTRFKDASAVINKKYQGFFEARKAEEQSNESAKVALCEELEALVADRPASFSAWDEKTQKIKELQERWKTIGFASRKVNNQLFERFRKSCDDFFREKAEYYKSVKDEMAVNLEKKKALCEKAEALNDSSDWKNTTKELVALQKAWKEIGPVSKKYSDAIWKRFIAACDYYFDQKKEQTSAQRGQEQTNLAAKAEVIEKLKAIDETLSDEDATKAVRELMSQWNSIGHVPFKEKDRIYKEYQAVLDAHIKRLNMNESRNKLNSFHASVQQMASDSSQNKLYRERERLLRSYEQKKNELLTYENNMGFLNLSSSRANGLVKEMERKMQKIKDDMQLIEQKIALIDQNL